MSHEVTPENIPYVVNPDGSVACMEWHYAIRGGHTLAIVVPEPKGPDEGWEPGQYEKVMSNLDNRSRAPIRAAIKKHYGTTSFHLIKRVPVSVPLEQIVNLNIVMTARREDTV